jgi:hypothetical protein
MKGMEHLGRRKQRRASSGGSPSPNSSNGSLTKEDDEEKCCPHHHLPSSPSKKRHGFKPKSLAGLLTRLAVALTVVYQVAFYIRKFTMSRPPWLYGSPMDVEQIQACLVSHKEASAAESASAYSTSVQKQASSTNVLWHWHRYSNSTTSTTPSTPTTLSSNRHKKHPNHRLLIAQYSGFGNYGQMLDLVAPVNQAYAKLWGHDFLVLQGTALEFFGISKICNDETRSTFNKIPLLQLALQHSADYDQVLILDTDAMIVNFDLDVTTLLDHDNDNHHRHHPYLVAAHRVWKHDWHNTWDINAGVTLWNLHHPMAQSVADTWQHLSQHHPRQVLRQNDDQYFLQKTLMDLGFWNRAVHSLRDQFHYYEATVIKHFKRDARSWTTTSLEQRMLRIQEVIQRDLCPKWSQVCIPKTYSKNLPPNP